MQTPPYTVWYAVLFEKSLVWQDLSLAFLLHPTCFERHVSLSSFLMTMVLYTAEHKLSIFEIMLQKVQAVGSHIAELHSEFVLALEMGALLEDVAGTVHAHPTMSEAFHESVLKTLGHAIHIS